MPELMVQLDDGQTVPLAKCAWVFYEPCGCPRGVMDAVICGTPMYDEDAAFREFFDTGYKRQTDAAIKREHKRGVTAELMTVRRYRAEVTPRLYGKCPHVKAAEAEAAGQTSLIEVSDAATI